MTIPTSPTNSTDVHSQHNQLIILDDADDLSPKNQAKLDLRILQKMFETRDLVHKIIESEKHISSIDSNNKYLSNVGSRYRGYVDRIETLTKEKRYILEYLTSFAEDITHKQTMTNAQMERLVAKQKEILMEIDRIPYLD